MAPGNPAHQPNPRPGKLVSAEIYELPLLPYEHDLISALGLSEQEYREFAAEVRRKLREADFKGQPVNGPVTPILINLAIGLVLTGVAMLLAPKPKQPEERKQRQSLQLDSQTGRTRFNNTIGFDGAPQLAQLGSRIPMPFGQFVDPGLPGDDELDVEKQSGGIIVDPLLVWSRMTSHGKFQTIKFLTIIGTSEISTPPELPGLMFGGQSLANLYKTNYWVGWSSKNDENKIRLKDTLYGEAAQGLNGSQDDEIFICPSFDNPVGPGFSQVYTPANTTSFGAYQPIPNGGNWALNWSIASFPEEEDDDIDGRVQNDRKKIAGNNAKRREEGMTGTGRAYSNKCGVVAHNGAVYEYPTEVEAQLDDVLLYRIKGGQFSFKNSRIESESGVQIGDLNSRIDGLRESIDDLLQVGVVMVMNRTLLRVISRPADAWDAESNDYDYQLKVIGFTGANRKVGIIGRVNINSWVLFEGGNNEPPLQFKGTGWYPLAKMDVGQVKNTRPVEVTEIGIRAQVYSQANGLANFNDVPSSADLVDYDEKGINVTVGSINKYMRRTSFFVLGVRDPNRIQGVDPNTGNETSISDQFLEGYDIIDSCTFAVSGNKPVDQYCWIRVEHPGRVALEYRLIPKLSNTIIRDPEFVQDDIYVLRGDGPLHFKDIQTNAYGPLRLDFAADRIPLDQLCDLPELNAGLQKVPAELDCSNLRYELYRDTPSTNGGSWQAWLESLDGGTWNLKPTSGNGNKNIYGQSRETRITAYEIGGTGRTVDLKVFATVIDAGGDSRLESHGTAKAWQAGFELYPGQTEELENGSRWEVTRSVRSPNTHHGNWFNLPLNVTQTFKVITNGLCTVITPSYYKEREFEDNAAIKEISRYQEITKSSDNSPEFSIAYVNESIGCDPNWYGMSVIGFKVRSLNQSTSFNQPQIWLKDGINVERLADVQHYPDDRGRGAIAPSNNFADVAYYLLTNQGAGSGAAGRSIAPELVAKGWFRESAIYLSKTWCRFDGAISESTNLRDYLTEIAPFFLCNFVIQNGKFALKPALPQIAGDVNRGPIQIDAMFNDGVIVAGSFKLTYLSQSERQDFRANMIYRRSQPNTLTEKRSILVQWDWDENNDDDPSNNITTVNQEDFDMSSFCTRRSHAFAAARYMLSIRRRVDHIIEFKTTPAGTGVAPGDFIRVTTQASPYENFRNGVVSADGTIRTPTPMPDGVHRTFVYRGREGEEVKEVQMEVKDGKVTDSSLFGSLFNTPAVTRRLGVYQVESVGIEEDGCVMITGSHHPVFEDLSSKIVYDVYHPEEFRVVEEGGSP